jgi:hypothetical protein
MPLLPSLLPRGNFAAVSLRHCHLYFCGYCFCYHRHALPPAAAMSSGDCGNERAEPSCGGAENGVIIAMVM